MGTEQDKQFIEAVGQVLFGRGPGGDQVGTKGDQEDPRVGRVVRFKNGQLGWILHCADEGRVSRMGRRYRPSYRVMSESGQQTWWAQEACTFIE